MSAKEISIKGLNKAAVLAALYNRAQAQGMGFLHYTSEEMTEAEAQKIWDETLQRYKGADPYFDYLKGRVMKVNISGETFNPFLYDRDNGECAAEKVITKLRNGVHV